MYDLFVQWCPPCRALLPELRKASIHLAGQMKFGTLDCTIHHNLCSLVTTCLWICALTFVIRGATDYSLENYEFLNWRKGVKFYSNLNSCNLQLNSKPLKAPNKPETGTYFSFILFLPLFFSITSRPIPPQSSLMAHLFMNMKDTTRQMAYWSS